METIILETVTTVAIFVAGVVGRLGIVLAVMTAVVVPFLAVAGAVRCLGALHLPSALPGRGS